MNKKKRMISLSILALVCSLVLSVPLIMSQSQSQSNGYVTLSFDDGWLDNYTNAWAEMKTRNMTGVFNIVTVLLDDPRRLNVSILLELQSEGNEIASHSNTHPVFADLTEEEIRFECELSKQILLDNGLDVKDFVYPSGNKDSLLDSIVSDYYRTGRYGWGLMDLPCEDWHVYGYTSYSVTNKLGDFKNKIDEIANTGKWGILYFHKTPLVSTSVNQVSRSDFAEILDYLLEKEVEVVTMDEALNLGVEPEPPTEEPPTEPPTEMSVEEWHSFWEWLKTRQSDIEWGNYLEAMLEKWKLGE